MKSGVRGSRVCRSWLAKLCLLVMLLVWTIPQYGVSQTYTVDISSYEAFRNATYGKWYICDNGGYVQCWDGAALLWQQLGRVLSTGGTGSAKDCWNVEWARTQNAGDDFNLIYNFTEVKRGDVVVMSAEAGNPDGHICYADEDYNGTGTLAIYGQNQGAPDRSFNVINKPGMDQLFLGAFRLKRWSSGPVMGTLDVNGLLDGVASGGLGNYGTVDVYIDDVLVANDVGDYCAAHPVGTSYWVTDIKPKSGYAYKGWASESGGAVLLGGTIGASGISLRFTFVTTGLPSTFKASIVTQDGRYVVSPTSGLVSVKDTGLVRNIRQDWYFEVQEDGTYVIESAWQPNWHANVLYGSKDSNADVSERQTPANVYSKWILENVNGHYRLVPNTASSQCLTLNPSSSNPDYVFLKAASITNTSNQLFDLEMHNNDIEPTDIYIMPAWAMLLPGETLQMEVAVLPSDATEALKAYAWSPSSWIVGDGETGLSIDASGCVTAFKPGLYSVGKMTVSEYGTLHQATIVVPNLPAGIQEIGEEAYANTKMQSIYIPDGCVSIGKRAFADNAKLQTVFIPESVTSISPDAFEGCASLHASLFPLKIYCFEGSAAHAFAVAQDIHYSLLG